MFLQKSLLDFAIYFSATFILPRFAYCLQLGGMAFPVVDLLKEFIPANLVHHYADILISNDLAQVIDVAMLDLDQIQGLTRPEDPPCLLVPFWERTKTFIDGWTTLAVMNANSSSNASSSSSNAPVLLVDCPVGANLCLSTRVSSSSSALLSNLASATKRASFAFSRPPKKRQKPEVFGDSLESREAVWMEKAKSDINDVFMKFAYNSPRFVALREKGTP